MITLLRNASKPILWIIILAVAVAFIFWGDFTPVKRFSTTQVGTVDGVGLDAKQYQSSLRESTLNFFLIEGKMPTPGTEEEKTVRESAWHRILYLNEAKKLQAHVSKAEVAKYLLRFPPFVKEGNFDPVAFEHFRRFVLPSIGIGYSDFEKMMRNHLLINQVISTLTTGINIDQYKVDQQITKEFGKTNFFLITLSTDPNSADIEITEEKLRQLYETRLNEFKEPEKRTFLVAEFPFDANSADSVENAHSKAVNFSISLVDENGKPVEDFESLAKQNNISVRKLTSLTEDATDETVPDLSFLLKEGFKLTKEFCDSNPVRGTSAFYVIRFVSAEERKPIPFEQVRTLLEQKYRHQEALSRGFTQARQLREQILSELQSGGDLSQIVTSKNLSLEQINDFVLHQAIQSDNPEHIQLASILYSLQVRELSQPFPLRDAVALLYIDSQIEPPDKHLYQEAVFQRLYRQAQNMLLTEWLAHCHRSGSQIYILDQN